MTRLDEMKKLISENYKIRIYKRREDKWNNIITDFTKDIFQNKVFLELDAMIDVNSKLDRECSVLYNPGRDETLYKESMEKLAIELRYLSKASSFIVK